MENLKSLKKYNTDINGSWGIGQETLPFEEKFINVLNYAIEKKASIIVKPSRGKYWYIKGINNNKSYEEIEKHIQENKSSQYKDKSQLWLLSYE